MISISWASTSPLCRSLRKSWTGFRSARFLSWLFTQAMYACNCWVHSSQETEPDIAFVVSKLFWLLTAGGFGSCC